MQIASHPGISTGTARNHIGHIYEKLHIRCRVEATAKHLGSSKRLHYF